jgi:hypothetical protein
MFRAIRMMGRCANGAERDGGVRYHALAEHSWKALCGAAPGRRSAGWADYPDSIKPASAVTCPKCRKKLDAQNTVNL